MENAIAFLQSIIALLVGGITGLADGLGKGITALVNALAVTEEGAMSPFLTLVVIFGGIALAIGLSRAILGWIGSLGGRNVR